MSFMGVSLLQARSRSGRIRYASWLRYARSILLYSETEGGDSLVGDEVVTVKKVDVLAAFTSVEIGQCSESNTTQMWLSSRPSPDSSYRSSS